MQIKVKFLEGKNINLVEVEEQDAEFIVNLRTDSERCKYLAEIEKDINKQREFIRKYHGKNDEVYFVIQGKDGEKLGLVRVYNITNDSFVPGSWIIKPGSPASVSMETVMSIYKYTFETLNLNRAEIDVVKGNEKVIAFHRRFGAEQVGEDEQKVYMRLSQDQYKISRQKYKRYLPAHLV